MTLELKLYPIKDRICAWEMTNSDTGSFQSGGARPFRYASSLDKMADSEYLPLPYSKKQIRSFDYIISYSSVFLEAFTAADEILPYGKYENMIKQTFGSGSEVYKLFRLKALPPKVYKTPPTLYIDFEAMNMRICGWYAELVCDDCEKQYEGIAKPYSDLRYVTRLWNNTYEDMLSYELDDLLRAKHINSYKNYFVDMFRQARRIYTYSDTDALFIKRTFGDDIYDFFKVKNIDMSLKFGNRVLSLDKACRLFDIHIDGDEHDPKTDVKKMRAYIDAGNAL